MPKQPHTFLIESETWEEIKKRAEKEDRSFNYIANDLLEKGLKKK